MPFARPAATPLSLKGRALRLLGQREHSRSELARKLQPHCQEGDDLDALLRELQDKGFLSDARAAASLVHRRAAGRGTARLRQELQAKGIDATLAGEALATVEGSEAERAHAAWQRRFGEPPRDLPERARQLRFLIARGFAAAVAHRTVPRCSTRATDGMDDLPGADGAGD